VVSSLQVALELGAHAGGETNVRQAVAVAIPVVVAAGVVSRWVPAGWATSVRPAAVVAVALPYLASVVTVWAIKIPWGRWTPRDISDIGDPSLFSPWYLPQGANGHYSFVSGHTSFAFAVVALVLVAARTRRAFTVGVVGCLVWGVVVAASRVVLGAHFPSDTLVAAVVTVAWAVLLARAAGYRPPTRVGLPPQAPWSGTTHPDRSSPGPDVVGSS
jgi:membrane-associated phospholipid phosphatase